MPTRQIICRALALIIACAMPFATASAAIETFDVSDLVPALLPSVVNILRVRYVPVLDPDGQPRPDGSMVRREAQGTGFIIDDQGIILTNRHVIDGAAELYVTLFDGTRLQAALMYQSPVLDLAMLRVRSMTKLKPIKWGDSDTMQPGVSVIAIGNPLGFGFTVTHGIVSATDRDIKQSPIDNFIQVDAPINPGNSGGPLFNIDGEVVGMNTALYTVDDTGGSVGLNFSIPGNDLQFVVSRLKQFGKVLLGTTGLVTQNLNQDMADAVGLPKPEGVVITYIPPGSPAADTTLQVGDIILQVDGRDIPNVRRLTRTTGALDIGATVPFLVLRDDARLTIPLKIGEAASSADPMNHLMIDATPKPRMQRMDLGLSIETVTDANRKQYGVPVGIRGAVVTGVMANTMGEDIGIAAGDVVLRINSAEITSTAALREAVVHARASGRPSMMVLVLDHHGTHWMAVPLSPAP